MSGKPRTTGLCPWLCPVEYDPRLIWVVSTERLLHRVAGSPEHLPHEIGARAVFTVSTEEIISRGESLRLRTVRSVVRGKRKGGHIDAPDRHGLAFRSTE